MTPPFVHYLRFLRRFALTALLALITASTLALAGEPIRLWDATGEVRSGYSAAVRRLPIGAEILLKEGTPPVTAKILRFLGNGNTSVIYEIEGGRAIRLAKGEGLTDLGPTYDAYLLWFAEGAERVERTETPIVKVFHEESWKERYLIVEALEPPTGISELYSLEDLVRGNVRDPALKKRMTTELLDDFAPKTWQLRHVADMRTDQLLYTKRGWIIADLSSTVRMAKTARDATLFSAMGKLPPGWRLRLEKKVFAARAEAEFKGNFVQFVLGETRRCLGWLRGMVNI